MKKNENVAAIDIGSHNCRLIIAKKNKNFKKVVFNRSQPTNLIKNLSFNNEFNFENITKTLDCLNFFKNKLDKFNVSKYRCVATEACRTAINSDFFLNEVKKMSNLDIEIISSEEEARLCLKSCKDYLNLINETGFLFDIGGGSTETTFFKNKPLHFSTTSIAYGVINLPEKIEIHGSTKIFKKIYDHIIFFYNSHKNFSNSLVTIGSCSTMTTICSIFLNLSYYDTKKIEGVEMQLNDVVKTIKNIKNINFEDLKKHPCIGNKYNLLLNGIKILEQLIKVVPIKKIIVTQKGLRDAIIDEL